ncbi:FkbM family methyltransferase [Aminobacter anthyllidis]|uniref:FkbM family methyltransferase n=1 Tax=Aminobacter anthyllidis TaxID=1035067 RepID=A0A9X1D2D7_9HYPH|nr:FkbM family methyltransferase [Aminobacter anthyllidis]MBT1155130.1 FkbM family methyltransferase [Aminobacter anthyllidis]MDH4985600.1 FkbM family methyltransferase [Aminobacter anthyllidis]
MFKKLLKPFGYLERHREPLELLKDGLSKKLGIRTAIHVGAHYAEEREAYEALGFSDVLWVEASSDTYRELLARLARPSGAATRHVAVNSFASDKGGQAVTLRHFTNEGASSSVFAATPLFRETWPHVAESGSMEEVGTDTLDNIAIANGFQNADLIAADVQGAELLVLKGAKSLLAGAKAVIVEVSQAQFYEGGVLQPELGAYLRQHGFVELRRPPSHGDQLFVRKRRVWSL